MMHLCAATPMHFLSAVDTLGCLAKNLRQPDDRHRPRADDVGEHLPRTNRRQLVDVTDQDQRGVIRHRPQQRMHQRYVNH
jgi:hypothetical protein